MDGGKKYLEDTMGGCVSKHNDCSYSLDESSVTIGLVYELEYMN